MVVGGGDTACEEALFLTRFASKVYIIHRRDELRASKIMADRALEHEKVEFLWDSVVEEGLGDGTKVSGMRVRNVKTDEQTVLDADGVFIYVGLIPATKLVAGQVELDPAGYIVTDAHQRTNVPGVFAAGDVRAHSTKQVASAAGEGASAALLIREYLKET